MFDFDTVGDPTYTRDETFQWFIIWVQTLFYKLVL